MGRLIKHSTNLFILLVCVPIIYGAQYEVRENTVFINRTLSTGSGDLAYWRLDGTNAPPTANWDMGGFRFTDIGSGHTNFTSGGGLDMADNIYLHDYRLIWNDSDHSPMIFHDSSTDNFMFRSTDDNQSFRVGQAEDFFGFGQDTRPDKLMIYGSGNLETEGNITSEGTVNGSNITLNDVQVLTSFTETDPLAPHNDTRANFTAVNVTNNGSFGGDIVGNRNFYLGANTAGKDIYMTFYGETNDGQYLWDEDNDYFNFKDDLLLNSDEKIYLRDTDAFLNSPSATVMRFTVLGFSPRIEFYVGASEILRFSSAGVVVNEGGVGSLKFRVEGDNDANLLATSPSNDRVGIGTLTPKTKLEVIGDLNVTGNIMATGCICYDGGATCLGTCV